MGAVLVKFQLRWPDPYKLQDHTIEKLDLGNFHWLRGFIPDEDLENPSFYLKRNPDRCIHFLEGDPRKVMFINDIAGFRKYWACPQNRGRVVNWNPQVPEFRLW